MNALRRMLWIWMVSSMGLSAAELRDFQDYVNAQRDLIDSRHAERMQVLNEKYLASLRGLMERVRQEGDLDVTILLKESIERFEREGPSELGPPLTERESFRNLQEIWLRVRDEHRAERAEKLLEVFERMEKALSQLEVDLTREGRLEEALAVRAERDRLREGPEAVELKKLVEMAKPEPGDDPSAPGAGTPLLPVMTAFGADLVLYFPFDRDTGKRVVDRSREQNHGVSRGAEWTPEGKRGGGMRFDGKASVLVENDESLQVTGDLTICMWLKPEKFEARRNPLYKSYGAEMAFTLEETGVVNYFYGTAGRDGNPYQGFDTGERIESGEWVNICIVRNLTEKTLIWYIDGRETARHAAGFERAATSNRPLLLGNGYVEPYIGTLDEVMIFKKALSGRDVERIYKSTGGL